MLLFRLVFTITALVFVPASYASDEELPPLVWSDDIQAGLSEAGLAAKLKNMGILYSKAAGGLTYTSRVIAGARDYLFCQGRLYAMIEGEFVTGEDFNKWFQTFLATHQWHGAPNKYSAQKDWGYFRAEWNLERGNTLYFELKKGLEGKQGWSRQLYNSDIGAPCLKNNTDP